MLEKGTMTLGVNYWASHAATRMWTQWDAAVVEKDLAALEKIGCRLLRVFPIWPDFQPVMVLRSNCAKGGYPRAYAFTGERPLPATEAGRAGVDETMMERFETLADLAQRHGMKLIVPLINGHMTFRVYCPPAVDGLDAFTDPESLFWQNRFVRYFVKRMKHHPAILAWELGNESNCLSVADTRAAAWNWAAQISASIRLADPSRPVYSGMHSLQLHDRQWETRPNKWLLADQAELCDMLTTHPYQMWRSYVNCDSPNTLRWVMLAPTENRLYADIGGKPAIVEEIGTLRRTFSDFPALGRQLRNILWLLWASDARALLWWCAFDQEKQAIAPYDWKEPGLEHGLFTSDRAPHPTAEVLRDFRRFLDGLPFDALPAREPDAVAVVTDKHTALGCYLLARQAGIHLAFCHARQALPESACYLLPSAAGRAGFSVRGWETLLEHVRDGATLYLSLNDTILSGIDEIFGAGVRDRRMTNDTPEFRFDAGFSFTLPRRIRYRMNSYGAEVLGREADGNPAFFRHRYGKGTVYLLNFPLEAAAAGATGGFETDAWKLYREILHPRRLAESPSPFLQLTEHHFADGRTALIAVNNQPEPFNGALELPAGRPLLDQRSDSGATWRAGTLEMPPNSGLLLLLG